MKLLLRRRSARNELRALAAERLAEWKAIKPLVEGTPPRVNLEQSVLSSAINASRKIKDAKTRVDRQLAKGEDTTLRKLSTELAMALSWFEANDLPH